MGLENGDSASLGHRDRERNGIPWLMLASIALGLIAGFAWPTLGTHLNLLGTVFIECIKMVVIPLIFSSVTLGMWKLGTDKSRSGRVLAAVFAWFFIASLVAIAIALSLNALFRPGLGANLFASQGSPTLIEPLVDWQKILIDLIPGNIVAAMAAQRVLPTLLFAIILGLALAKTGDKAQYAIKLLESVMEAMFVMTRWIVSLAPVAVFGIMAWLAASQGTQALLALAKLIAVLYIGFFLLWCFFWAVLWHQKLHPLRVTRDVSAPVLLGFTTRSSQVTLPLLMETLCGVGVPRRLVSVILPLGYSFNLDGAALYQALTAAFLVDAYGMNLNGATILTIVATTLIASKGLANVPSASLISLATVTHAIGLPPEALAVIAGADVFMDMGRTATNVFGNAVAAILAQKFERSNGLPDAVTLPLEPERPGGSDHQHAAQ
jgi:DAACS family dicarboxylate/amino acid:cation (Na+ or H+) symporter